MEFLRFDKNGVFALSSKRADKLHKFDVGDPISGRNAKLIRAVANDIRVLPQIFP